MASIQTFFLQLGLTLKNSYYRKTKEQIPGFDAVEKMFFGKSGIEIGGPSRIFRDRGFIPLYHVVKTLDGCNFSNSTIWEGSIVDGQSYRFYPSKVGRQFVMEASDLSSIADSSYEFVLSSNCLEHVANPIKAVSEWIRVLKEDGLLLLVLPNKMYCFDHKRPDTTFSHLMSDFQNQTQEDDLTHLDEILELHDLEMERLPLSLEQFRERSLKNAENRALHLHVFNMGVLIELVRYFNLELLYSNEGQEYVLVAKKVRAANS